MSAKTQEPDPRYVAAVKKQVEQDLQDRRGVLERVYAARNHGQVAYNVHGIAMNALTVGMIAWRVDRDLKEAIRLFARVEEYTREMDKAIELIRQQPAEARATDTRQRVDPENFELPLYCLILAGQDKRATEFARLILSPEVVDFDPSAPDPALVRLLAALVRRDEDDYAKLLQRYEGRRKTKRWESGRGADFPLYEAVRKRDAAVLEKLLPEKEAKYLALGRQRGRMTSITVYGGGATANAMVFDFVSTAMARLALQRGVRVTYDSEVIPRAVYSHGF